MVWFVILIAMTHSPDSGVSAYTTLEICHEISLAFSKKHHTPIASCKKITREHYEILTKYKVTFEDEDIEPDNDEVEKLRMALKKIGKLHQGKTADSKRTRAIIRKALK